MKLHYSEQGSPRCGVSGEVTSKKSLVSCARCRKAMKKRVNYMAQADALFSLYIRRRDGACIRCGRVDNLQCAHIISRSYKAIRTNEMNAVALDRSCHVYFTHRPLEWVDYIEFRVPGRYEALRSLALAGELPDWRAEVERLEGLLQEQDFRLA